MLNMHPDHFVTRDLQKKHRGKAGICMYMDIRAVVRVFTVAAAIKSIFDVVLN